MREQWQNNNVNPYNTYLAQRGTQAPEIAPWRFNVITSYNFTEGTFQGVTVGGAYRWEDAKILGYELMQMPDGSYATDVDKPLKGDTDDHLDLWIGYSRKLTDRINWRVQLNLRNVFESTRLVPITMNPD